MSSSEWDELMGGGVWHGMGGGPGGLTRGHYTVRTVLLIKRTFLLFIDGMGCEGD